MAKPLFQPFVFLKTFLKKTAFSETSHADFGSLFLNPDNFNKVCCDGPFSRNNTPAFKYEAPLQMKKRFHVFCRAVINNRLHR